MLKYYQIIILAIVLAPALTVHAQTSPEPTPSPTVSSTPSAGREFFKNILEDQKAIWTAPFHLRRMDTKWVVPGSIGLMALATTDRMTGDEMGEFDRQLKTSRVVSYAGSVYGLGAVAASFYLAGRQTNDARTKETGLLSAEALVDSVIVGAGLKGITQRARPLTGKERSEFFDGGSSFPSGHSIQAWSVATVVANEYSDRRSVQIAAYGIASAVSVARFTGQKHYLSDVLAGSAMGYGIGKYVYHKRHRNLLQSSDQDRSVTDPRWPTISPQFDRRAHEYGVGLTWSF